jgi:sugar/nucleoside kinase (ribokinase family)
LRQEKAMTPDIICIGSVLWDIIGHSARPMDPGADMPGRIRMQPGGVALNIAVTLARLGLRPTLLTAIGQDAEGEALIAACRAQGLDCAHVHRPPGFPTDRYMAIEGGGKLVAAIADAHTLEAAGEAILAPLADGRLGSVAAPYRGIIALDGNLTETLLAGIAASPLFAAAILAVAPASPGKAERLRPLLTHPRATLYVNLAEASGLAGRAFADAPEAAAGLVAAGAARVLVTDGGRTAADGQAGAGVITGQPPAVAVARVTGAGDAFMAAHVVATGRGSHRAAALAMALQAAATHVAGEGP